MDEHDSRDPDSTIAMYALSYILPAELHQWIAYLESTKAEVGRRILLATTNAFENMGAKMARKVDQTLPKSLDTLMRTIEKWSKCEIPSEEDSKSSDVSSDYMICIREYILTTGILRAISQHIKEMIDTKSDKQNFKKKVDNLTTVIKYLVHSPKAFDFLAESLKNKIDEGFYKARSRLFGYSESEDRQTSYVETIEKFISDTEHTFQTASKYIEKLIKALLENPEENIKKFDESIKNSEYYRNMYKN